jgi:hypothetical protein
MRHSGRQERPAGSRDFSIEVLAEMGKAGLKASPEAFPSRNTHLADPAILQEAENA